MALDPGGMRVVVVPGWHGSGSGHWQQQAHPAWERVEQADWEQPDCREWVATLDRTVAARPEPVVLVAHSLGVVTVAHWACLHSHTAKQVQGALLVAPPDVECHFPVVQPLRCFAPVPCEALPFPSILIASENDPYAALATVRRWATAWGSRFVSIGAAGHINADSGFGPWPEGLRFVDECQERVGLASGAETPRR